MLDRCDMYLGASSVPTGAALDCPALLDSRFGSALFNTVFTLVNILLSLFSFSFGTEGPPCAGELMLARPCSWFDMFGLMHHTPRR